MADLTNLGKKHEAKVKEWLNHPEEGFFIMRLPDQLTGFFGSSNMCDFLLYKKPYFYPLECKATYNDRFDFNMISENQHKDMMQAAQVDGVTSYIVVLFASYQSAFLFNLKDIVHCEEAGIKSVNIKKKDKWKLPYIQVRMISSRKALLDMDFNHAKEIFGEV